MPKLLPNAMWRDWLIDRRVGSVNPDSPAATLAHRKLVESKAMLRLLFEGFYRQCWEMDQRHFCTEGGRRIEIGSGAGLFKKYYPEVISSDAKCLPFVDVVLNADQMPFPDSSLRSVYAINVFHHLPEPRAFFTELLRVLKRGGGAVFIEPYYGPVASWLFPRLHAFERFDPETLEWEQPPTMGLAAGANQALSFIVFKRDYARFIQEFPALGLVVDRPHTHLLYLMSGGVNFRQLVPDFLSPVVRWVEELLTPLNPVLALQHTIVLRKG